jgi:L-ascorbate metabolism protein UlaG (beta-lactamase superfamily)
VLVELGGVRLLTDPVLRGRLAHLIAGWGPTLGPGHLDPERAARAAVMMRPRTVVPIHWGTLSPRLRRPGRWFRDPPHAFAARVADLAPAVDARVIAPGESLDLPPMPSAMKDPRRQRRS